MCIINLSLSNSFYSNRKSIHLITNSVDLRRNLADLELLDVPVLTATIAVARPAHILLVHIHAHVPEVLEAVVHGHPLRGLTIAYNKKREKQHGQHL
jgi:hypothetical protein